MAVAGTQGVLIIDKNGGCHFRVGANTSILPITAMTYWNSKLIVGCGSAAGAQGNLAYFNKSTHTEMGDISDSTYETDTIASEFRTKMDDLGMPDTDKRLTAVTVVYYDSTDWNSMTMTVAYRMAKVTSSSSVAGGNSSTGSWTTISPAAITLDVQSGISYKTLNVGSDPGLAFQTRVTANGYLEVVEIIMHFAIGTQRQQ